jgi:L-fuconolactonase
MTERIDSHCHLWRYSSAEYAWISDDVRQLQRDFLPADLERELTQSGTRGAIAVQARQTIEETECLLAFADESEFLEGVIGWAPISSDRFPEHLEGLRKHPKLKGLRHVIQDEVDPDFINSANFNRGIHTLRASELVYEILVFERQLPGAIQFVDRHPNQLFVLDHIGKPRIREKISEPWQRNITEIANRDNVYCKLSGLVTEADWATWSTSDLQPYFDAVLDSFGPTRIMAGSDWPVCTLAGPYSKWMRTLDDLLNPLSSTEKGMILGNVASELYNLQPRGVGKAS